MSPYLLKLIHEHFPTSRDAHILDLGCGAGALLYFAQQCGYRHLSGVDVSSEQVAAAQHLGLQNVTQSDLFTYLASLPSLSYDAIITLDVIEHLTKDELMNLADQVYRILVPAGRWIIHCPNGDSPFVGSIRYGDWTQEQAFTTASLEQLRVAAGFTSIQCFEDAPVPHGLKSMIRNLLWNVVRTGICFVNGIETGAFNLSGVYSRNFLAITYK